jgi:hypothetical protein
MTIWLVYFSDLNILLAVGAWLRALAYFRLLLSVVFGMSVVTFLKL